MSGRWTLFFENPNVTAAVLAELAVFALCVADRVLPWGRRVLVALAWAAAVALAATGSRGGFVALTAGVGAWAVAKGRACGWRSRAFVLPLAAGMVAVVVAGSFFGLSHRLATLAAGNDASVNNRLLIWRRVPRMMADAPGGWGVGNSGRAFMNWYQPPNRSERYRTLVGSHATWLVEFGGWGRTLYVFGWVLVLALAYRRLRARGDALPAALWTALAVAAIPTSVLEQPAVWVLPAFGAFPLVGDAVRERIWIRKGWLGLFAIAAIPQTLAFAAGAGAVHCGDGGRIVAYRPRGETRIDEWIVPAVPVVGDDFPRRLRKRGKSMGMARSIEDVPPEAKRLILCGARGRVDRSRFSQVEEIVYLAPAFGPSAKGKNAGNGPRERFVVGEFAASGWGEEPGAEILCGVCEFMPEAAFGDGRERVP